MLTSNSKLSKGPLEIKGKEKEHYGKNKKIRESQITEDTKMHEGNREVNRKHKNNTKTDNTERNGRGLQFILSTDQRFILYLGR